MPEQPYLTPIQADIAQQHEMFTAYLAAGFSRKEALELLKTIVATNLAAAHQKDKD